MKKFRFRLQSLLLVRETAERRLRDLFLAQRHAAAEAEARLRSAADRRERLLDSIRDERIGNLQAWNSVQRYGELALFEEQIAEARARAEEAARKREEARREWVESRRQLKIVERLRDSARAEHAALVAREEQANLDELSVLRHGGSSHQVA